MTRLKTLAGMALAVSLLGFAPVAEAAPIAAAPVASAVSADGLVVKTVTRAGVAHRSTRRTARRVNRR
jgi:hypothetical protein